jgi:hypothetical protein
MAYYEPSTIHDKGAEGDSAIYVGIKYLGIVADQLNQVRLSEKYALRNKGLAVFDWLLELRVLFDLVEARMGTHISTNEIDSFKYEMNLPTHKLEKVNIKIKENEKYEHWFNEIEKMIERNAVNVTAVNNINAYNNPKYINDKKILFELSRLTRELLIDANKHHLIMPEGQRDMKSMVRDKWLDRDKIKEFGDVINE